MEHEPWERLSKKIKQVESDLARLRSELNRIGETFEELGRMLIEQPQVVSGAEAALGADISRILPLVEKYRLALVNRAAIREQLNRLSPSDPKLRAFGEGVT